VTETEREPLNDAAANVQRALRQWSTTVCARVAETRKSSVGHRSASRSISTSTARSVRSSSQSISNSAKVRVFGSPSRSRSRRVEVGEQQDVEQLGAGSRPEGVERNWVSS